MDSIDEIEAKNNRNIETAELVSNYMRANAQRAAQKAAQERERANAEMPQEAESPPSDDADKLDFSSEFSTGDMGLSQQKSPAELLAWKRQIEEEEEEEDEERDRSEQDEEQGQPEEWKEGGWQGKEPDGPAEEVAEDELEQSSEDDWVPPPPSASSLRLRPAQPGTGAVATPLTPTTQAIPSSAVPGNSPSGANTLPQVLSTEAARQFWSEPSSSPATPASPARLAPSSAGETLPVFRERLRPTPAQLLPPEVPLEPLEPTVVQLARRLIMNAPGEAGYQECVRLLARFGAGALRMCSREKVKIEILDESDFASHEALLELGLPPEQMPCDGAYLMRRRLVLVDRRCLLGKPRYFHPALYYFAHAFDHAQGGETFSSQRAAAVVACFEASTRAHNGFDFVDELAAADPVRYFARSVAVYLGRDDCSEPLWSSQDLHDFDRSMHDYLQYLFARLGA